MTISAPMPAILEDPRAPVQRAGLAAMALLSVGILAVLCFWMWLFPFTADGDSVLHYHNARDAAIHFGAALSAWSRPGYTIPLSFFAPHGEIVARLFNACVAVACAWQTVRLAEDLKVRARLAAGIMLLLQPPTFALAADTMTEIPMALAVVVAVRLWISGRRLPSSILVGFLPWFRPEGFFIGAMWGVLVLLASDAWKKRALMLAGMALGLVVWAALCREFVGSWLAFEPQLSWPADAAPTAHGPLWYYAARWPEYCGLPLFTLWLPGIWGVARGRSRAWWLVGAVWLLVFAVHSILYWRGLFASWGLIRLLAAVSPMTAVICLRGWNMLSDALRRWRLPAWTWRTPGLAVWLLIAAGWAVLYYCAIDEHFDCFPVMRCARYIEDHKLLAPGRIIVAGNQVVLAALGIQPQDVVASDIPVSPQGCWQTLHDMPVGSILVWDNKQSLTWFSVSTETLEKNGFTELDAETIISPAARYLGWTPSKYVVLRKDGPMPEKRPQ